MAAFIGYPVSPGFVGARRYRDLMPARSNDFQAVVYFVKAHLAPDATVIESASLRDRTTGQTREVDVLITGQMAGHLVRIGVECRDQRRRADVSWVEEMRSKHADLPTDRLVLVSASGFTATAAAKALHYNIETVTPGRPIADDGPLARIGRPRVEFRNITHDRLVAIRGHVELNGQPWEIGLTVDHVIFAADGAAVGCVGDLVKSIFQQLDQQPDMRSAVAAAHDGDQYLVVDVADPRVHLDGDSPVEAYLQREVTPPQLLRLLWLRIISASRVDVRHVELSAGELQGTAYAYGSGHVGGADALLVFTQADNGARLAHLSVRLVDASGTVTDWVADRVNQQLLPHAPDRPISDHRPHRHT